MIFLKKVTLKVEKCSGTAEQEVSEKPFLTKTENAAKTTKTNHLRTLEMNQKPQNKLKIVHTRETKSL